MDNELNELSGYINNMSVNEEIITKSNTSYNVEEKKITIEDRIILNVGGVKVNFSFLLSSFLTLFYHHNNIININININK